ncbi:DUF2834 domain-containing protein [Pseudoalteromonas byunsanensis]|uniref:DUF2834 domain-containing protein n=1 Tax=Pseudoalteromonas byunsanensis TaxID=327939 RepID=A0A1S1N6D0_9GAMM|nr:DUF2834 domain-containing protein [Pseudoalteromonas byunsanensis]OHU94971.1 hypothetical protein BIW53_13220 [Pseudoalteromonas byunsanensis]
MKHLYFVLTFLGACVPLVVLLSWLAEHGLDVVSFYYGAISHPVSLFAWLDVIVAALVLVVFIVVDGNKHQVAGRWYAIVGTLCVGVSFGFPLYLYLKERGR